LAGLFISPRPPAHAQDSGWKTSASTDYNDMPAQAAVDGSTTTRWASASTDMEWWQADFGAPKALAGLDILWEAAYSESYRAEISDDAKNWRTVYNVELGDGGRDILRFAPVAARYLRIQCYRRGSGWGNSIWEISFLDPKDRPILSSDASDDGFPIDNILDGDPETFWRSSLPGERTLVLDLIKPQELGGLEIIWGKGYARKYAVESSADAEHWTAAGSVVNGHGSRETVLFSLKEPARFLRLRLLEPGNKSGCEIAEIELKAPGEGANIRQKYQALLPKLKKGRLNKWLSREQEYWTVVGSPEDDAESLLGETGVVEPYKGSFSVTPFIHDGQKLVDAEDVERSQSLEDGYLPVPAVQWKGAGWSMEVKALSEGKPGSASTYVRYRFVNESTSPFKGSLSLAVRPIQVNPIWQNGGMSPIKDAKFVLSGRDATLMADGRRALVSLTKPSEAGVAALDAGEIAEHLENGHAPKTRQASDPQGKVGAAALYDLDVPAGGSADIIVAYPQHKDSEVPPAPEGSNASQRFDGLLAQTKKSWKSILDKVDIQIPEKKLTEMMRSNLAYILINADDPWFMPGSRNYSHAWMRDGAVSGTALLRMGHPEPVARFLRAFTRFIREDGLVPFVIQDGQRAVKFNPDGTGEGQEYDSQGEFAFIARQYFDFTKDHAMLSEIYPAVRKSLDYGQGLIEKRKTPEYRDDPEKSIYYGILPPSNSHEGYFPARHSYWDDFWMLKGFKDGARLAEVLGQKEDEGRFSQDASELRKNLYSSMIEVAKRKGMSILAGCADLGDVDPTGTTIGVVAAEEAAHLPRPLGPATFDYYHDALKKRIAKIESGAIMTSRQDSYTPYEIRNADALVRMGGREKALEVLRFFLGSPVRPAGWNQLAEVVHPDPRSPNYIGDMPHTWVGADFINAARAVFAYEDEDRLVVGAGLDPKWLDSESGVKIGGLPTVFGKISYGFKRTPQGSYVFDAQGDAAPAGGFTLSLPKELSGRKAFINGKPALIREGKLVFPSLPARIELQ
jgi:hypothetical protein